MENERFALNSGRKRPAYTPKDIHCPSCGAGLTVKDERSELVVCDYCGSHLDVSQEEKQVLGKGGGRKWDFPLNIGDSFRWKKVRYEIISRMVFLEDDDEDEASRQYLLYNPYRGTLWLDEYKGNYSLSSDSHVMPTENAFSKKRGDSLTTFDNQQWVMEGTGTYELVYVDGALPWIAHIGDRIDYAEFVNKDKPKLQYEAQRIYNEIEYGRGKALSLTQVRRALEKPDFAKDREPAAPLENVADILKSYRRLLIVTTVILIVNVVLYMYTSSQGKLVLEQRFSAQELTQETLSKPFTVVEAGDIIKISVEADVSNAWMALDVGVVRDKETLIHTDEANISYYYGQEGGESWSEGTRKKSLYVKLPWEGTYQLFVHAVSASGNAESATEALHDATIRVYAGALVSHYFLIIGIIAAITLAIVFSIYHSWKNTDD